MDQLTQVHEEDHNEMINLFSDILHNHGCILDRQAFLQRNQQRMHDRMDGFEEWIPHMESHIHDSFHLLVDESNDAHAPNEGNL